VDSYKQQHIEANQILNWEPERSEKQGTFYHERKKVCGNCGEFEICFQVFKLYPTGCNKACPCEDFELTPICDRKLATCSKFQKFMPRMTIKDKEI
jgi:hypothetical protein